MQREPAAAPAAATLRLGDCTLDLARGELLDAGGRPTELRAQALRVLCVLGARAGQAVGKDELMQRVWGDVVVTEDSLVQAVGDIRRVLGPVGAACLRTVPRRGYRLEPSPDRAAPAPAAVAPASHGRWLGMALLLALLVAAGLAWYGSRSTDVAQRSLAILPFEQDEPTTAADAWFVDSITADLNSIVAGWRDVRVIGERTMRVYKGRGVDPRAVARELGVAYVVAGRVRRDDATVNITVEMLHGDTGSVAWTQQVLVDRAELPRSIGQIAGGMAKTLLIELGRSIGERNARLTPEEAKADDLAMQGMSIYLTQLGPDNFRSAQRLFEQALEKDPHSVRGLAGLSMTHTMSAIFRWAPDGAAAQREAEAALARLEAIDPDRHLTLLARAGLTNLRADWPALLAQSDTLIERFPNDPTSHHHRCASLLRLGRFEESIPACERAIRISPRDSRAPIWNGLIGMDEFMRARYEAAAERTLIAVNGNPRVDFYKLLLVASLAQLGRRDEALQRLAEFRIQHPNFDSAQIAARWPGTQPDFVAGRERIAATVRALGLP
jgi:DNA-binding winged helix-turn-helix (wHTH) protein/TolB-like protein